MADTVRLAPDEDWLRAARRHGVESVDAEARVMDMVRIMAKVAARDFSEKPSLVEGDDSLSLLTVGFRFMIEDMERMLRDLERERVEMTRVNTQLMSLDESKTRFINTAAHELGTPLTPILVQLALLRNGSHGPLTPKQEDSLAMLDRNIGRLGYLVNEMLDVARLQSRRMRIQIGPCDVAMLARQCVQSFHEQAHGQGIELSLSAPQAAIVPADDNRVNQVLFNLVSNALKFTPPGGHVVVAVEAVGDSIQVTVRDDGAGLEAAEIARLFQPFSQVHDVVHGSARGGTGLGLYICKGIVELHGGHIGCSSHGHGMGSRFQFTIPTHVAPRTASSENGSDEETPIV